MTKSFRALLLEGLKKFAQSGYTSEYELRDWLSRLSLALDRELPTDEESRAMLASTLESIYQREMKSGVAKRVPGVFRYTLDQVAPNLRAELDKRIYAGADLIRLNKRAAVEKTLQRFSGWVTSQPTSPTAKPDVRAAAREILKPVAQVRFERRRVAIDQGHKLLASISHVVAMGAGAIAAIWHDRGEDDHGYDARPEHLKRSGKLFLVRDSWAAKEGLIKKIPGVQYTDEVDQVAQLPFCSCTWTYLMVPHDLPEEMLTAKGRLWVRGQSA